MCRPGVSCLHASGYCHGEAPCHQTGSQSLRTHTISRLVSLCFLLVVQLPGPAPSCVLLTASAPPLQIPIRLEPESKIVSLPSALMFYPINRKGKLEPLEEKDYCATGVC